MAADDARRLAAISAAGRRLRVDHAGATAIRALESAGIPSILLKGPSIARWLYESDEARAYADCDLLVPPHSFAAAVETLRALGFQPEVDEDAMPRWWREHALTTLHSDHEAMVDLHRSLPGVEADDDLLWTTLSAITDEIVVGGVTARTLTESGRLMHIALHAAQHGGASRDLDVLMRALSRANQTAWRQAAELAAVVDAQGAFALGLNMIPEGARLAERLGLDSPAAIDVELRATGAVEALTVARFYDAPGVRARFALVGHKLLPPATFMRKWSPMARRGRSGLALAYLYRPVWVIRRSPRALRAWRDARRDVEQHRDPPSS